MQLTKEVDRGAGEGQSLVSSSAHPIGEENRWSQEEDRPVCSRMVVAARSLYRLTLTLCVC
jgi:hypothetical protein